MGGEDNRKPEIDWKDDLKFFIDQNNDLLIREIQPAIRKHKLDTDTESSFNHYIKPLKRCMRVYANMFQINDIDTKISKEDLIVLAKQIAEEQNRHIGNGDYDVD